MWATTEAVPLRYGGVSPISKAIDISHRVIHVGLAELRQGNLLPAEGVVVLTVAESLPCIIRHALFWCRRVTV